ncbi:unnamed protein product [Parajaminaea phylloscopi]
MTRERRTGRGDDDEDDIDPNLVGNFGYHRPLPLHRPHPSSSPPPHLGAAYGHSGMGSRHQHSHPGWHDVGSSELEGNGAYHMPPGPALSASEAGPSSRPPTGNAPAQPVWTPDESLRMDDRQDAPLISSTRRPDTMDGRESKYTEIHDAFHLAHGGKGKHSDQVRYESYDEQQPIQIGHLFRRPVIRQFLHNGKLYREKFERESSRFELYFDLIFVGVAHQLADGLNESEGARSLNVAKFALTLFPLWSLGYDVRIYINESGLDDMWTRLYLMIQMLIMVGYTANATACRIYSEDEGIVPGGGNAVEHALSGRSGGETAETPLLVEQIGNTGYWFAEGYLFAITSAAAFFLLAKMIKVGMLFVYGLCLPKFRRPLWLRILPVLCLAAVYLPIPIIPVYQPGRLTLLLCLGVGLDITSRYLISYLTQWWHGRSKRSDRQFYTPATSVEHLQERTVLYVLLFAGEAVLSSTYSASTAQIGVHGEFGRSALSVLTATCFTWVYFDSDASRVFVHALRRNPFTAITFNVLHYPLTGSLILQSSSLHNMIAKKETSQADRWVYGSALSCALAMTALIGLLHKNLDVAGSAKWPHHARIALRIVVAAIYAVVPIFKDLTNTEFLAVYAGLLMALVISETLGKLGAVGRRFDPVKADQYYAALNEERRRQRGQEVESEGAGARESKRISGDRGESFQLEERTQPSRTAVGSGDGDVATASGISGRDALYADFTPKRTTLVSRFFNPYTSHVRLSRRSSWHPYDDLTADEQGNEDVGIEGEIGQMEVKERLDKGQRWAMVSS